MASSRFSPDSVDTRKPGVIPGLLLAVSLQPASIKLLLGCDDVEAKRFQDDARGALFEIKRRVERARKV